MADKCEAYVRGYSTFCNGSKSTEVTVTSGLKGGMHTVSVKVVVYVERERVRLLAAPFGEVPRQWKLTSVDTIDGKLPGEHQLAVQVSGRRAAQKGEDVAAVQQAMRQEAFVLVSAHIERCAKVRASIAHLYKANWPKP